MSPTQANNEIEIFTPLGKDVLLLEGFTITEELGRLFKIEAECCSTIDINFEDLLGQNVSIRLDLPTGKRFFNGHVSSISQGVNEGSYARYTATIHPWLWFLTRTSDCRIFQNITAPDIIKQVCNDLGFFDINFDLIEKEKYLPLEYCCQYRETDFNFLSRLMEEKGIYYHFSHEEGKHKLCLADGYGSHKIMIPGVIPYYPPNTVSVRDEEYIDDWFLCKKIQPGAYALNEFDPLRSKADLNVNSNITRSHSEAEHEIYDYPGEYVNKSDGEAYARMRIQELHTQYEQGQGRGIVRSLACGDLFFLSNFPRDSQNCEYLVVSATHSIHIAEFESDRSAGGAVAYSNNFTVIKSDTQYRSARITPKPVIQGPQTAIVVGEEKEEIHTDKHARVIVEFPWDRYSNSDENSSCWIRVAQIWAGKKWGGIHIPRIGQEVIVEFLEGNPDRPIITGRLYNDEQPPPYDLPENKTQSGVKTRSSKKGTPNNFNELRFEDEKDKEEIHMHAERNLTTIVESDESRNVCHDRATVIGTEKNMRPGENIETEIIWGSRVINVHGNDGLIVMDGDKGREIIIEDGDHILEIEKGDNVVTVKKGNHIENIALGKKTVEAMQSIEFKVGPSSIKIDPSGITLDGPMIKLKGVTIDIEATGMLKEKAPVIMEEGTGVVMIKGGVVLIN